MVRRRVVNPNPPPSIWYVVILVCMVAVAAMTDPCLVIWTAFAGFNVGWYARLYLANKK